MLESPLPPDDTLNILDTACQGLYPICNIKPSDPKSNLIQLVRISATAKLGDIRDAILTYLSFTNNPQANNGSPELTRLAIEQIPKHLRKLIAHASTQQPLYAILNPPIPQKILPPPITISENKPPAGLHAISGTGGLNFSYIPNDEKLGEGDVLAWIGKHNQGTVVPSCLIYSVGFPHRNGMQPLQPARDAAQRIPLEIDNLKKGLFPDAEDAFRVDKVPCERNGILPIPSGYKLAAADCYDGTGKIIPKEEIRFTQSPVAYGVNHDGLASITYELMPDDTRTQTLKEFLEQKISEFTLQPGDFLHPYLLTAIESLKGDPILKPKIWETPKEFADRFLQKTFPDAVIHKCPLYGASKSDNLRLHAAYTQGVLDIYALYSPIMSCSFYADFYARLLNALGIPSVVVGCYATDFSDVQGLDYLRKQPHAIVASLYQEDVHFFDPTPSQNLSHNHTSGNNSQPCSIETRSIEEYSRIFKTQFSAQTQEMVLKLYSYLYRELTATPISPLYSSERFLNAIENRLEGSPLSQQLHLLDCQLKMNILDRVIWNAWVKQITVLSRWNAPQLSTVNENISKLTERLGSFYGIVLQNPVKSIAELTTVEKRTLSSVFKRHLCSSCFLPNIPYPHPEMDILDKLALKATHFYDRLTEFIQTFQISELEWNKNISLDDRTETIAIGNETFCLCLRDSRLLKHFLPLMFVVETLDPGLLKQIQEKYLPEALALIEVSPVFKATLETAGKWIDEHGNPETLRAAVYSFYLYYLFPPGTPERAELALFYETLNNFVFPMVPSKAPSCSTKPTSEDFYQKILFLLKHTAIQSELGIKFLESMLVDYSNRFYEALCNSRTSELRIVEMNTYLNEICSTLAEDIRVTSYSSSSHFTIGGTLLIKTAYPLGNQQVPLKDIQTTAKKILSTTSGTFLNPYAAHRSPKTLLKKFERQNLSGKSASDVDYKITHTPGKRPVLREDGNAQFIRSLSESVRDIMRGLKSGNGVEATRLTNLCAEITSIFSLQDAPETHLVKLVQMHPTLEHLEALAQYLDSFLTPPSYLKPIYSENLSSPKKGEQIYVELYDLLDQPEKVRALFDFLDLKQKTNTHHQPLEVTLYFCGIELESFDLRKHPLEPETIALFKLKASDEFKPNTQSFTQTFWMRYVQAGKKKERTPQSEFINSEVRFPMPRLQTKPQKVTIVADPRHWGKTIQMLQKQQGSVNIALAVF